MTRINVVPVEELCNQHLQAEWREVPRIPNGLLAGKYRDFTKIPLNYTVRTNDNPGGGRGHVYFFADKLGFLQERYQQILAEAKIRGLNLSDWWPDTSSLGIERHKQYIPTDQALHLNRKRIQERMPKNPKFRDLRLAA